jgi:lipopolysaccharide assembly protein A
MSAGRTPGGSPPSPDESAAELEPGAAPVPAEPEGARPPEAGPEEVRIRPTRTSTVWTMVAVGVVLLAAILVFILQNNARVQLEFLFLDGTLPLGVALLFAVVLGALLVLVIGVARVLQLRMAARQLKRSPARWRRERPPS